MPVACDIQGNLGYVASVACHAIVSGSWASLRKHPGYSSFTAAAAVTPVFTIEFQSAAAHPFAA